MDCRSHVGGPGGTKKPIRPGFSCYFACISLRASALQQRSADVGTAFERTCLKALLQPPALSPATYRVAFLPSISVYFSRANRSRHSWEPSPPLIGPCCQQRKVRKVPLSAAVPQISR